MMHRNRRWCVGPAASAEDLARKLTGRTWTLCTGFFVEGHPEYLFLNDSTCEDAVQEYAALRKPAASGQPFLQVWRVLMNDGTLWLNLGDTYADKDSAQAAGVKPGDVVGLPWRAALALQADGWFLRTDIIWHKPNPKPESVKDRPTKSHEYLFLLSKRQHYYYDVDATREPVTSTGGACFGKQRHSTAGTGAQSRRLKSAAQRNHPLGKNKRSVWSVPVACYPGAHFAVFPPELIRPCILAGCPKGGAVLDCFAGSGTTAVVANELGRDAVLIELNPVYVVMQKERTAVRSVLNVPGERAASTPDPLRQDLPGPTRPRPGEQPLLWDEP